MNCLITGSTGFLGQTTVPNLEKKHKVRTVSLRNSAVEDVQLEAIDTIIHLAGLAHQMQAIDPKRYFDVNRDLTLSLAKKAKASGVNHFIFISTVKVYGDDVHEIMNEDSVCHPTDPYGQSKLEAEQGLEAMANDDFIISIIRPPLIYGLGVKGNLDRIIKLCIKLPFLPFGKIRNERSMVYAGNVTALIDHLVEHKTGGIFIAGDQHRQSTSTLVDTIVEKMNLGKTNFATPGFIRLLLKVVKPKIHQRLFGDFIIDNSLTNKRLGFDPPYSFEEGVANMVKPYFKK